MLLRVDLYKYVGVYNDIILACSLKSANKVKLFSKNRRGEHCNTWDSSALNFLLIEAVHLLKFSLFSFLLKTKL